MMSSTAVRLAALSSRGHAPRSAAAALPISAESYFSASVPSIGASKNIFSQKRSHHHHASSSSTQFLNTRWNGSNKMSSPISNSMNASILNKSGSNDIRWFSSKSNGDEEDQTSSDSKQAKSTIVEEAANTASGSSQHNTWVEFQKSIAVSGFETGQTVREQAFGKKSRGGKIDRKRKEREAELEAAMRGTDNTQLKGGEFPSLRYSDEETERLLAQAYAAIPPRAGKRGTRNLKRQKRRWEIKRQYDATKKQERMEEHERRMAKRHEISQAMYNMRVDAVDVREREQAYQMGVMKRWAEMQGHGASGNNEGDVAEMET